MLLSVSTVLSSCGVNIPNIKVCADEGSLGAHCSWSLSGPDEDVTLAAWQVERFGMLCMEGKDYASIKAVIEKLCHQTKDCTEQNKQDIQKISDKMQSINNGTF